MQSNKTTPGSQSIHGQSRTTRRAVLGTLGVVATTALAGCSFSESEDRATEQISYSVSGDEVDRVTVSAEEAMTVRGHDGSDVQVEATKYAVGETDLSDVTVDREPSGGQLDVSAEVEGGIEFGRFGGGFESLDVRVPRETPVTAVSVDDGVAEVADVTGDLDLTVDDGRAEVGPVDGFLDVSADDGTVTVGAVDGVGGDLDDGSLEMTEPATIGDLQADDGELDLAAAAVDGTVGVRCDDGDITVALAPTVDASVDVTADDGSVQIDGDVFDTVSTDEDGISGRIGDGTNQLEVDVDDGDVHISPQ